MDGYELLPINAFCYNRWTQWCLTGRESTFGGVGGLREEAINAILNRYDCNDVSFYETIISIETQMVEHLQKEHAKSKAQRQAENERLKGQKRRGNTNANQAPQQAQGKQNKQTYTAVVPRPTMKLPKGGK